MAKRTASAIEKAWRDVDALIEKWDAEGWPNDNDERQNPPALSDAQYIDVSQLVSVWKERQARDSK